MKILVKNEEICNCNLEEILNLNQSNASRHITKLKNCGLINQTKLGKWCYYSINKNLLDRFDFIEKILNDLNDEIFSQDLKKLEEFKLEKNKCLNK